MSITLDRAPFPTTSHGETPSAGALLDYCLQKAFIHREDWENTAEALRHELVRESNAPRLMNRLVHAKLLTNYQVGRIEAGTTHGLILGSYRVLNRLGVGGMGVVFLGEHIHLRRLVAIKVLPLYAGADSRGPLLTRFFNEIRVIAKLQHPNIVWAIDTGEIPGDRPDAPVLYYHVMEYVPGKDLEELVQTNGPLSLARACDLAYQIASALVEADKHGLVHRDMKPSNVLVTPEGQAKLLDFGLARWEQHRHTQPGVVLGTLDYLAPEQARDASAVDIRADIYGLGGILCWALTGDVPFPSDATLQLQIAARLTQAPPSISRKREDVPVEMDAVIARMMATNPADRYATPQTVMRALLPFLRSGSGEIPYLSPQDSSGVVSASQCRVTPPSSAKRRVLIVDDERMMRAFARSALECDGLECEEAEDGMVALELIHARPFDLVLLDMEMPMLPGDELLRRLRSDPASPNLKVILASGRSTVDEMAAMLSTGADDFLAKPFGVVQLMSRVKAALRLKESQDRADALAQSQRGVNEQLEQSVRSRDSDVVNARNALTLAVAELVAFRGFETSAHLVRMQKYVHTLAQEAAACPAYAAKIDEQFLHLLESTAPLHDVGMIGLPDQVLLKPGKLTDEERILMRTHTTIGADILQRICRQRGFSDAFLQMAIDVTRHHHERWDGKGYPDHLAGEDIPLAARCVCIADVYDALRSRRPHKPALSHAAALAVMTETSHGQFDPMLLTIFQKCAGKIEAVFKSNPD